MFSKAVAIELDASLKHQYFISLTRSHNSDLHFDFKILALEFSCKKKQYNVFITHNLSVLLET